MPWPDEDSDVDPLAEDEDEDEEDIFTEVFARQVEEAGKSIQKDGGCGTAA